MLQRVVANFAGDAADDRRFFVEEAMIATVATLRHHRYDTCLFSGERLPEIQEKQIVHGQENAEHQRTARAGGSSRKAGEGGCR
jgi:hypothetical protein